jgi:hypothetical protein
MAAPPSSITFDVCPDLKRDGEPLRSALLRDALEARGVRGAFVAEHDAAGARLVDVLPLHGFLMAMHTAYTQHRALVLGPDDVWGCVAQGIARHVHQNAEQLRPRLVRHTGKIELEVRRDELAIDPHSVPEWAGAIDGLASAVREHLGGRADLFVARFSTTGRASRVSSQIALLGAVQSYFEYVVSSLCGIPRVTLLGTPDDWAQIRERARVLGELDLGWWAKALDPVLAELEQTARGKPSVAFWRRAYKVEHASGGEAISGWVNALFPYSSDSGDTQNPWFELGDEAGELELPKLRDYPSGIASAPFTWRLLEGERPMRLVAGFFGVAETAEGALTPALGWAVTPATPERRFRALPYSEGTVTLSPRDRGIASLEGIGGEIAGDGHALVNLSLWWSEELVSLAGIEGVAAICALEILRCDRLEGLEAVSSAPGLRRVSLQQCARLVDLRPLAAIPRLEELAVNHCPAVVDYSPLADLPATLRLLDLFGDGVPAAVRGRHEGRAAVVAVQSALRALRRPR